MSARDTERGAADELPAEEGGFLSRWSRRKKAAAAGTPLPEPLTAPPPPQAAEPPDAVAEPLPDPALLTFDDDFTPFLKARVAPELKKAAMKKLFAEPGFNEIDGLDVYLDDFNLVPDLPAADLATLRHAREVLWPVGEAGAEEAEAVPSTTPSTMPEADQASCPQESECAVGATSGQPQADEEIENGATGGDRARGPRAV